MVTFIDLNTTNEDRETVNAVKKAFDYVFRYTNKVNVHVIFNFKSPINIVGNYKNQHNHKSNFCDNGNNFRQHTGPFKIPRVKKRNGKYGKNYSRNQCNPKNHIILLFHNLTAPPRNGAGRFSSNQNGRSLSESSSITVKFDAGALLTGLFFNPLSFGIL